MRSKLNEYLFIIILLLLFAPPSYPLLIHSSLLNSFSILRYLILGISCLQIIDAVKHNLHFKISKNLSFVILIYLFAQSISIIKVVNIIAFLTDYKNIFFSIVIFIVTYNIVNANNIKKFVSFIIFFGGISLIYQLLIYFFPNSIFPFIQNILHEEYLEFFNYQFNRQRFFSDSFAEILIPLILYKLYWKQPVFKKIIAITFIGLIAFLSLLSNWRIKLVIFVFSLFVSLKLYNRKKAIFTYIVLFFTIIFLIGGYFISENIIGFNTIDRLLLRDKDDIKTIEDRIKNFDTALSIASIFPVTGVGLGNYLDYLPEVSLLPFENPLSVSNKNLNIIATNYYPHNIFINSVTSSGILGLLAVSCLILYFLNSDLKSFKKISLLNKSFIITFWALFIVSLTTPTTDFLYQLTFWFYRGTIEKLKVIDLRQKTVNIE